MVSADRLYGITMQEKGVSTLVSVSLVESELEAQAKAEKKAALGADKDVAQFEVLFGQAQEIANKMRGMLLKARGREDPSAAQMMEKALRALADAIGRCAE